MKKALLSIFLVALAAFNCSPAESDELRIGATLALSGKLAFVGQAQREGLQMAVDEVNRSQGSAGRKIALVIEDNAGDPKQAVAGTVKLLEIDKVEVLFAGLTHIVQAVAPTVKARNKVFIYGAGIAGISLASPRFFRDWGDARITGEILAAAVKRDNRANPVYLAEVNDVCAEVREGLHSGGLALKADETFNPGETDFRPILLRLLKDRPDALVLCAFRDSGTLLTQLKNLGGIKTPTYHSIAPFIPVNDTPEVRALYEENGAISSWFGLIAGDPDPRQRAFVETFSSRYGQLPRMEAALAYEDVKLLAEASRRCLAAATPECLGRELGLIKYSGINGDLFFDQNRRANRVDFLMRVVNGKWERLK